MPEPSGPPSIPPSSPSDDPAAAPSPGEGSPGEASLGGATPGEPARRLGDYAEPRVPRGCHPLVFGVVMATIQFAITIYFMQGC